MIDMSRLNEGNKVRLANVIKKLKNGEEVTVGFIGALSHRVQVPATTFAMQSSRLTGYRRPIRMPRSIMSTQESALQAHI